MNRATRDHPRLATAVPKCVTSLEALAPARIVSDRFHESALAARITGRFPPVEHGKPKVSIDASVLRFGSVSHFSYQQALSRLS